MADCDHNWVHSSETKDTVTHKCSKCGDTYTRDKQRLALAFALWRIGLGFLPVRSQHVGRFYAVALAVMVTLCVALTIWAGTPT